MQTQYDVIGKVKKVKSFLCLIKYDTMKAYGGVGVQIHIFLTSALVGSESSASGPAALPPGKEPPVPVG
jgi:hypothetical protein